LQANVPKAQVDKGKGTCTSNPNTRVFVMGADEARQKDDVITGMFPIKQKYAHVLFDSGANKSFVSSNFMSCLDGSLDKLHSPYVVEVVDGFEVKVDSILRIARLALMTKKFL
jgi:hypothetical protein